MERFRPPNYDTIRLTFSTIQLETSPDRVLRDPDSCNRLIDELYRDWGDPSQNAYWQNFIISHLANSRWEGEETRRAQLDGITSFVRAGGGRLCPRAMTDFGVAIMNSASAGDRDALALAGEVFEEAHDWAIAVKQDISVSYVRGEKSLAERQFVARHGPAALSNASPGNEPSDPAELTSSQFCSRLRHATRSLLRGDPGQEKLKAVRDILQSKPSIADGRGPCVLRSIEKLVSAYCRILDRGWSEDQAVVSEIGRQMHLIALDSELRGAQDLWEQWAALSRRLGNRAPTELIAFVRTALEESGPRHFHKAMNDADRSFKHK